MKIRRYRPSDEQAVRHIQFETGFIGKSMDCWLSRDDRWTKMIDHYLKEEPDHIFVAEDDGKILGYVLGSFHKEGFSKGSFIADNLKLLLALPFIPSPDRRFWWGQVKFAAKAGFGPEADMKHPAGAGHLHINLLPAARGKGAGSRLLRRFEEEASKAGVKRLHADSFRTRLNPNENFWRKNGYVEHDVKPMRFWKQELPEEEMEGVCWTKEL